jgi:hypothetical protein
MRNIAKKVCSPLGENSFFEMNTDPAADIKPIAT